MENKELILEISNLVNQNLLDRAEELLINHLKVNPQDVDMWGRLVILETLSPLEDYEQATKYLQSALSYNKDNHEFIVLLLFFTEWYQGGLDPFLIKIAEDLRLSASAEISSIVSYILAWHYKSEDNRKFELLLIESIQLDSGLVNNYADLGKHYLSNENIELGTQMIQKALTNVKQTYTSNIDEYDLTNVSRFIFERITGVFMPLESYNTLKRFIEN